jgi:glycosyltransferase involved in cell wall biosynthesis
VLASDLPVLREVGGSAATYCAHGDVTAWTEGVAALLRERRAEPARWDARRALGHAHARQFSWEEYARRMVSIYRELLKSWRVTRLTDNGRRGCLNRRRPHC